MINRPIKLCFFPGRESSYARSRVLLKGLREAGVVVHDCSSSTKNGFRYVRGFVQFLRFKHDSDVIFVGFFGQFLVPLVRLFSKKKIVFDTFLSAYQTLVFDRKAIHPGFRAASVRFIEKLSCRLADVCLLDTQQHIEYFVREYDLDRGKFRRSFLGAEDPEAMDQTAGRPADPIIHFHGEFQALHGVKFIIETATRMPELKFRMVGSGRELDDCMRYSKALKADNVEFIPFVPFETVQRYIRDATICLGIFGDTQKAQLVIPIKVYEALAMGKPIVTADTPAIRELLTHGQDVFLCKAADPDHLALAIQTLLNDEDLRNKIAANARQTFLLRCAPKTIGQEIADLCEQILNH